MSLNSIEYLGFFLLLFIGYCFIPGKLKRYLLLIASLWFYSLWSIPNTILLFISALGTYFFGIFCDQERDTKRHKIFCSEKFFLVAGIVLLAGELYVFKYLSFSIQQINSLFTAVGSGFQLHIPSLLMPVGISFYVFQSLGYLVDVYRGKVRAERNVIDFLLFITFFPKIVQGPIERSDGFLKQIKEIGNRGRFNYQRVCNGMITIIWGLFIKMVIADRISIVVDKIFSTYYIYGTIELAVGAIGYAIQIYCDFAGYSAMAAGVGKLFGFDLIQNFDCPYFSASSREFWRRWHISLSSWFRDYVYIPLGGSRCSKLRKWLNILTVMLISGIWHGTGWSFIAWGLIHGIYQVIGDVVSPWKTKLQKRMNVHVGSASYKLGSIIVTFILVDFAWVFFRASSISIAADYIRIMFTRFNPWVLFDGSLLKLGLDQIEMNVLTVTMLIMAIVDYIQYKKKIRLDEMLKNQCLWFKWGVIIVLITLTWVCGEYGPAFNSSNFIYQSF